jgi:DNA polymerase III epsilon subunit-like protein
VVEGLENTRVGGWYQGRTAIILDLQKQPGANVVDTLDRLRRELPRLQRSIPAGARIEIVNDRTDSIRASISEVQFTLLEATGKKAAFIKETIAALGVSNARILNDRAETAGQDHHDHRAKYDAVVARAVGKLNVLAELTVPFAREAGSIFLIKGDKAAEEVEEAKPALYKLHTHVVDLHKTATGTVVVLEKTRATPRNYPRLPGEPKRRPLG